MNAQEFISNYGHILILSSAMISFFIAWITERQKAKNENRKHSLTPYTWLIISYAVLTIVFLGYKYYY